MAIPTARQATNDTIIMACINTQHSPSKYTITACQAKVKFSFSLDVGRIIAIVIFYIVLMGILGVNIFS